MYTVRYSTPAHPKHRKEQKASVCLLTKHHFHRPFRHEGEKQCRFLAHLQTRAMENVEKGVNMKKHLVELRLDLNE